MNIKLWLAAATFAAGSLFVGSAKAQEVVVVEPSQPMVEPVRYRRYYRPYYRPYARPYVRPYVYRPYYRPYVYRPYAYPYYANRPYWSGYYYYGPRTYYW